MGWGNRRLSSGRTRGLVLSARRATKDTESKYFGDAVAQSTLRFSLLRMRNATKPDTGTHQQSEI